MHSRATILGSLQNIDRVLQEVQLHENAAIKPLRFIFFTALPRLPPALRAINHYSLIIILEIS